jgi:Fe-S cluster biogenesis protein NfuA
VALPRPCAADRRAGWRRRTATSTIAAAGGDATVVVFTVMTFGAVTVTVRVTGGCEGAGVVTVSIRRM